MPGADSARAVDVVPGADGGIDGGTDGGNATASSLCIIDNSLADAGDVRELSALESRPAAAGVRAWSAP